MFYRPIVSIFLDANSSRQAYDIGINYVRFIGYFFIFIGLKSTTDGLLRGAGDMKVFTIANLINLGIRVFVAYQLTAIWGIKAVWYAIHMGWAANYIISFVYYKTGKWAKRRLV